MRDDEQETTGTTRDDQQKSAGTREMASKSTAAPSLAMRQPACLTDRRFPR
jgi:hypothetical protein